MTSLTPALILTCLLGFASLSGCAFPWVYKLNIQQGNIVTQDMLNQLDEGMTHRQVAYVMGNPVLKNPYKAKQWDYFYTLEKRDEVVERYLITVFFDDQGLYSHYTGQLPEQDSIKNNDLDTLPGKEPEKSLIETEDS